MAFSIVVKESATIEVKLFIPVHEIVPSRYSNEGNIIDETRGIVINTIPPQRVVNELAVKLVNAVVSLMIRPLALISVMLSSDNDVRPLAPPPSVYVKLPTVADTFFVTMVD